MAAFVDAIPLAQRSDVVLAQVKALHRNSSEREANRMANRILQGPGNIINPRPTTKSIVHPRRHQAERQATSCALPLRHHIVSKIGYRTAITRPADL
jgi:hypothetical protein